MSGSEITIIGAGIAGLTSAVALARKGFSVRVFEQAGEISEIGAGLQITPNGVAVLDALGLAEPVRAIGLQPGHVVLRDYRRGKPVTRLDMSQSGGGRPYLLVHRADLVELLADEARAAGVQIDLGRAVVSVALGSTPKLVFERGEHTCSGLLIGADGLKSRLRRALEGPQPPAFTGQVAWRALVPGSVSQAVNVYMAPGRHVVTYPLRGGQMTNIVGIEERKKQADEGWDHVSYAEEFRTLFADFCPDVTDLLARVETVNIWGLYRHPVAQHWYGPNGALIGDAAHPTLPFLAQGANMALEDAWVLADCLTNLPKSDALAAYQARRQARVVKIVTAANANARNYHLHHPLVRFGAHSALRLIGTVAPGKMLDRFGWLYDYDVTQS